MKAGIHPSYKESKITCACGATFTVNSTKDTVIEVCDKCHPFYTGDQNKQRATGNVEKFNRKFGIKKEEK